MMMIIGKPGAFNVVLQEKEIGDCRSGLYKYNNRSHVSYCAMVALHRHIVRLPKAERSID